MSKTNKKFLEQVFKSVRDADESGLASTKGHDVLGGLSGLKTVGVLQRLTGLFADRNDASYLEVGVFQGLTLLSVALSHPDISCFGIDDFSILDPEEKNLALVEKRFKELDVKNASLINEGFETAFEHLNDYLNGRKIGVYFYDGAHDYRSQILGLMLARPHLHEDCVLIVDDANYEFVRQSTYDFLKAFTDFKMVFEGYSPVHPANMDKQTLKKFEAGWLNGINILVRDPGNELPSMLPPVREDKSLYVNDWLVHRHQLAELTPEALNLAQDRCCETGRREIIEKDLRAKFTDLNARNKKTFKDRNTHSDLLTEGHYNDF